MNRSVLLFDKKDTPWVSFLSEYFEDTDSQLHFLYETPKVAPFLDHSPPELAFLKAELLSPPLVQKLKVLRQSRPESRLFHLGPIPKDAGALPFDDAFVEPLTLPQFQKQLTQHFILPDHIRILVIDDEPAVGDMMKDYWENRTKPTFEVQCTDNGQKGLKILEKGGYDVVVLDIKMPSMSGCEVYREIKARGIKTPVVIYFDAIFGDEMVEVHKYGRPAVVEKGSGMSTMPEMTALIKKMVYFG